MHILNRYQSALYLEVLKHLLTSPSCPRPVLALCGPRILSVLFAPRGQSAVAKSNIDVNSLAKSVLCASRLEYGGKLCVRPMPTIRNCVYTFPF